MNLSAKFCTPNKQGLLVPSGYILCHPRWNGTDLVALLKTKVSLRYIDGVGEFDFLPSSCCCVIYLTESDVIENINNCKRRIAKLRNADTFDEKYVLYDKNDITKENFSQLQDFAVLDCNISILPLEMQCQAVDFLLEIAKISYKPGIQNMFFQKKRYSSNTDVAVLSVVQKFPQIGSTKAKLLLEKFGSIHAVVNASNQELASVIGQTGAQKLKKFFNQH